MTERTPLEKAVDKAFAYHPYRIPQVELFGGWIAGPTFMVRGDYTNPVDGQAESIFTPDPLISYKAKGLLDAAARAKPAKVSKSGHDKKQGFKTDKYGAEHPATAKSCTCRAVYLDGKPVAEIAFPLLSLGKKVGVDEWEALDLLLYGYKKGELVAVLAMKSFDTCLPEALEKAA